ncbi:MAG: hypothetical protein KIT13_12870 [Burkholderiales bacterium]|nr:hypothetical protein [Burkholderiales bacterium]
MPAEAGIQQTTRAISGESDVAGKETTAAFHCPFFITRFLSPITGIDGRPRSGTAGLICFFSHSHQL